MEDEHILRNIWDALSFVEDPELHIDIVNLGLIYDVRLIDGSVEVDLTLTSPACPMASFIIQQINDNIKAVDGVQAVTINLVFEPPWTKDKMSDFAKMELNCL